MEHTDFNSQIQAIQLQELDELLNAVKKHNGQFRWLSGQRPAIIVKIGDDETLFITVIIIEVSIQEGKLSLTGIDYMTEDIYDIEPGDVFPGGLSRVTEALPDPET